MPDLTIRSAQTHSALPDVRLALRQAMTDAGQLPTWTETYTNEATTPPMLYADGRLIWQWRDVDYALTAEQVGTILSQSARPIWYQHLNWAGQVLVRFLTALFIAFFPKCPFCWAAYMSYIGATGIVSVPYRPWLIWGLVGLLIVNVSVLYQTRHRQGPGPFYLCLVGAAALIIDRLYLQEPAFLWIGMACLLIGSLWNSLSTKMADSLRYFAQKLVKFSGKVS